MGASTTSKAQIQHQIDTEQKNIANIDIWISQVKADMATEKTKGRKDYLKRRVEEYKAQKASCKSRIADLKTKLRSAK